MYSTKEKQKAAKRKYYLLNRELVLSKTKKYQNSRIELLNRIKTKPCMDCGVQYNPWIMQFDHRNPQEKEFTICENKCTNIKRLMAEVEKCDVVCSNCHANRTYQRRKI